MAEYILPLDPAFLSPDTGQAGCLHDTRLCRAPDTDQSCQIELGDNQDTTRVRENHPRPGGCSVYRAKWSIILSHNWGKIWLRRAGDGSAGCVLIRQKDAASLYFDNHPSCVR